MADGQTKERWWAAAEDDPVHRAAAEWLVRLQDPALTLEESLEWQRWIGTDERHARAFARLEDIWQREWDALDSPLRERKRARVGMWALAASATFVAIAAAWMMAGGSAPESIAALTGAGDRFQTKVGENRTIGLSDGSSVTLGGKTELVVSMEPHARRIELLGGEALFTVAKDTARPFTVSAGDTTVTAIGTEFNVRRSSGRVVVAVVEGRVAVAPQPLPRPIAWLRPGSSREPAQLGAGELMTVAGEEPKETVRLADPSTSIAWRSGQLIFREEPLRYAVEDVNRYSSKPIVLADERIGDIRISGTVLDRGVPGWLDSLESAFGLEAREEEERIVLERARR